MMMPSDPFLRMILVTLVFGLIGIILFGITFFLIVKITPFSIRKEIEEDQNTSLAILIGSVMIGIALIVAAAVHG
jgi:putative membrane protein